MVNTSVLLNKANTTEENITVYYGYHTKQRNAFYGEHLSAFDVKAGSKHGNHFVRG